MEELLKVLFVNQIEKNEDFKNLLNDTITTALKSIDLKKMFETNLKEAIQVLFDDGVFYDTLRDKIEKELNDNVTIGFK